MLANENNPADPDRSVPVLYSFRRCPYAIRARMALAYAGITVELREIKLRNKPPAILAVSPKGTVPILLLPDRSVIDESLDIMQWSLCHHDPDGWLNCADSTKLHELIDRNDGEFKFFLDRYKYSVRFPKRPPEYYRACAETFLGILESHLSKSRYLFGDHISLADVAVFPFIRQFSKVDLPWFQGTPYEAIKAWLCRFEQSELFLCVMKKYKPWVEGEAGVPFGHEVSAGFRNDP